MDHQQVCLAFVACSISPQTIACTQLFNATVEASGTMTMTCSVQRRKRLGLSVCIRYHLEYYYCPAPPRHRLHQQAGYRTTSIRSGIGYHIRKRQRSRRVSFDLEPAPMQLRVTW